MTSEDKKFLRKLFKDISLWIQHDQETKSYGFQVLNRDTGTRLAMIGKHATPQTARRRAKELRKELIREEIASEKSRRIYAEMDRREEERSKFL